MIAQHSTPAGWADVKICHRHGHGPVSVKGAAVEACGTVQSSDLGARKEAVAAVACVREQIWVDSLPKREHLRCPDKMLSRLVADNVYRYLFDGSVCVQDGGGGDECQKMRELGCV